MSSAPFPPLPVHWGARTRLLSCRPAFCLHRRGEEGVTFSFLPAVYCLFGCKGAIAALCPFLCPHWWKGSGCVVCPFLRAAPLLIWGKGAIAALLPALLSAQGKRERAHCFSLPACCSLSIGSRDAIAAPQPTPLPAPEKGEQLCCRPFRLLIPLPIEVKRCNYRPAVYSFVRAGEGVRRTAPLSTCPPAHWGKKVRLPPCCPLLCPRRGRGSAVLIPFHLFPCPLGRQSAIVAPLSTPLAAPGKRKQPCCPCHLAAAPAIGAQNTVVVPSSVPLSALGKRRAGVSSAPFRLPFPVYWRQRRDCRPPFAPLSALWEGAIVLPPFPLAIPCQMGCKIAPAPSSPLRRPSPGRRQLLRLPLLFDQFFTKKSTARR